MPFAKDAVRDGGKVKYMTLAAAPWVFQYQKFMQFSSIAELRAWFDQHCGCAEDHKRDRAKGQPQ